MPVVSIPAPPIRLNSDPRLSELYNYLYRLHETLGVALIETEEQARETAYKALGVSVDKTTGKVPADAQNAYQQLKALIVKTANDVSANYRKLVYEMTEDYRAQSDYGTYEEYLRNRIEADASGAIAEWDRVNGITEGMDYIANSSGYIKVGLVKEYPDGTADVGVVVGQDLRSVTIDGKEIVTSQNLYSLWTADSLSFWRNGTELTRIGLEDFFVERAYISETTTQLLQSPTFGVQLVMRDDVLKAIAGKIDLSANQSIKLAVGSVQVGGTNYLRDSGTEISTSAYNIANYNIGITPKVGETYTIRLWGKLGSDRKSFTVFNSGGYVNLATLTDNGDGTYSATFIWKNESGSYKVEKPTFVSIYQADRTGTSTSTITRIKLEQGNKATDWSPNPEEFRAGSAITMTEDEVRISTTKLNVNIVSEDGEANMLSIDEEGANMPKLIASNVAVRYDGPSTLYVNPSATAAQIEAGNYFRSLADACAALSYKWVQTSVTINLAAGMTEYGTVTLRGCSGGGWLTIQGNTSSPAKLVGKLQIYFCNNPVTVTYLNVDSAVNERAIDVAGGYCDISYCVVTGKGTANTVNGVTNESSVGIIAQQGARVMVGNCELYDTVRSLYSQTCAQMAAANNKGNCIVGANRTHMFVSGTAPSNNATTWNYSEVAGGKVWGGSVTVNQGSKPTPVPAPTSANVTANLTDSWYSSSKAWLNSDNYMRQGYTSNNGEWSGCMWFNTSAFSGKTIKSATLTIKRDNGYGRSGEVTLKLWGITATTNSGNPNTSAVSYGALGTIENGETKAFTLPITAAQALASGTIKGFMLRSDDGGVMSGRTYSYNYCRISTMPVLAVTFT